MSRSRARGSISQTLELVPPTVVGKELTYRFCVRPAIEDWVSIILAQSSPIPAALSAPLLEM